MFLLGFVLTVNDSQRLQQFSLFYHMKVLMIVCAETPSSIPEILLEEKKWIV